MHSILVLVGKDFSLLFRSKMAVIMTFLMPLALVWGISSIYGIDGKSSKPSGIPVALVNESASSASSEFVAILKTVKVFKLLTEIPGSDGKMRPITETDLRSLMQEGKCRYALVLPKGFLGDDPFKLNARLVMNSREEAENQIVSSVLEGTMTASVPAILIKNFQNRATGSGGVVTANRRLAYSLADGYGGDPEEIYARLQSGDVLFLAKLFTPATNPSKPGAYPPKQSGPFVRIEVEQYLGADVKSPQATHLVGGWAIQFLLFAVSGSAAGLFAEKNLGIFQRLLSGPVKRSTLLWSKFFYGVCLGLVQLMVLFIAGHYIVGFEIFPYLGSLTLVCLLAAAACSAFGMLIASISRSIEAATGLSSLLIMLTCAIGGVWFPSSLMPEFVQKLSKLSLVYWTNYGFTQVLWAHAPFLQLLPTFGVLIAIVAIVMSVAVWRFNRGNIFR